eukprot:TRINITY_DN617_c0_g4_i6.p1 TRINITY_DN617_c0_g4~~TRINITY_DN617_c0_g4_i6.p1  ORF type:complete len:192 (+),score=36.73 TRINITY_DN617_c0_g4_i6:570-1145(+)
MEEEPFAPSAFGGSLIAMMITQKNSNTEAATLIIPEPLYYMARAINELGGHRQEGIFRIPGETGVVNQLRTEIQHQSYKCNFINCNNAATLFKLFIRELEYPLIPYEHYAMVLRLGQEKSGDALKEVLKLFPQCHQDTLWWIIEYIQTFLVEKTIELTKMDRRNFAVVFVMNATTAQTETTYFLLGLSRYH